MRHHHVLCGKLEGRQADRRAVREVGRVHQQALDVGQEGNALATRELRNLFAHVLRRHGLVVLEHLHDRHLVVGQPRVALVRAQEAENQAVGVGGLVDTAQAVEAPEVCVAEVFRVVQNRCHVLQNPPVVVEVRRRENEPVDRHQKLLQFAHEILDAVLAVVGPDARERDVGGRDGDAVVRVAPGSAVQQERGFVLDGARGRPPGVPGAEVHERRLLGIVCKKLVPRLFLPTGKERDARNVLRQRRAVKDLLEAVAHGVSEIGVDEREFPPGLDDRDLVGRGRFEQADPADNLELARDAPGRVRGDRGGTSGAQAGVVQQLDLGEQLRVLNHFKLQNLVGVVRLEYGLDIDRGLRGRRGVFRRVAVVERKDPRAILRDPQNPELAEGGFVRGIRVHPGGLVVFCELEGDGRVGAVGVVDCEGRFVHGLAVGGYAQKERLPLARVFRVVRTVELALDVNAETVGVDADDTSDLELEGVYARIVPELHGRRRARPAIQDGCRQHYKYRRRNLCKTYLQ